jgi:predicted O-linked N-acetylglucosamine transferase (SPINDLY family)
LTADIAGSHPVAQFVRPLLRAHREHRIDSVVYFNGTPAKASGETLAGLAEVKAIGDLDDHDLARAIADDGLDLLVDLSGHTQGTRLAVMAYRPAPVQACFVGYPHSTGFKPVDYLFADPVVVPQGAERLVSEKVARLPHAFLCFVPPHDMPQPHPRKADGPVVFGSLNHLPKVTAPTVALWAKVLHAVPDSRLLMKCAAFGEDEAREPYRRRFAELGIADERLTFEGPEPFADAMRAYDRIDVALDTLPYNGGTTTCHALWMGVPVVTLEGGNFCGRMGASFVTAAGFPDLVASDEAGFVDIASRLAADRAGLDALKAELREKVPTSPLCDIEAYAGDVAALYRKIVAGRTDDN